MARKILQLFHKSFHNINQAALILAFFTLLVQLTGLIRDRLLAGHIGPGPILDLYNAAFPIPDLIFALGASVVSVTILMPFLAESMREENDMAKTRHFLNTIFTTFFGGMILVSIVIGILMPWLVKFVAPGFSPEMLHELILLSRIMLLSPILLGLSNLVGTITQLHKKFFVFAMSPVLYNVGIIIGILFLYPIMGVKGLIIGVIIGALLHFLMQIPVIIIQKLVPRFVWRIDWRLVWHVISISIPRTFTLSCNQIAILIFYALASKMSSGSISIFKFALTLQLVPISIIGTSYAVAAFPNLVEYFTTGKHEQFLDSIIMPARRIIFWSIPITVLFIVLRAQIVRVILGVGQFSWSDTRLVAASMGILVIGVTAQSMINLVVRAYYAAGRTWRPLLMNAGGVIFEIILALTFIKIYKISPGIRDWFDHIMRVSNVEGAEVILIVLAFMLGTVFNYLILWYAFKREFLRERRVLISTTIWQSIIASLGIGAIAYVMLQLLDNIFNINTFWGVFAQGFIAGIIAICFGILILILMKNEEILSLLNRFFKKKETL